MAAVLRTYGSLSCTRHKSCVCAVSCMADDMDSLGRVAQARVPHLEGFLEWVAEVLGDAVHSDAPHRSDGQGPEHGIVVVCVLQACLT